MKKLILILVILALIIAISGCTNNQTPPANKTYSANGLSFVYPGNWENMDKTAYQSFLDNNGELLVLVGDGSTVFGVAKINNNENYTKTSLNNLARNYNLKLKNSGIEHVSEKPIIVNDVEGCKITASASGNYLSSVLFVKNNTSYLAIFKSSGSDQQTFNQIINSLKVP